VPTTVAESESRDDAPASVKRARYMPRLLTKSAEYAAVAELDPVVKSRILPLFEVPPAPRDRDTPSIRKPLVEHLTPIAKKLSDNWGSKQPLLLDMPYLDDCQLLGDGDHGATVVFSRASELELQLVPVTGLHRGEHYNAAVADAAATFNRGLAIRLVDADLANTRQLDYELRALIAKLTTKRQEIDVIIDLKQISKDDIATRAAGIVEIIKRFPMRSAWRSLTILSGAFPVSLANLAANRMRRIPRCDWELWRAIINSDAPITPLYGDYVIDNPVPFDPENPKAIQVSANIRYTSADVWVVLKGMSTKKNGWEQSRHLSEVLVGIDEYMGAGYSTGDAHIDKRSRGVVSCGNPTIWRRVGITHHLTFTANQLAMYGGS
jgi:hypothetical protein